MVITGDPWSEDRGFESQHHIVVGHCLLKKMKINKQWPGKSHFLKKDTPVPDTKVAMIGKTQMPRPIRTFLKIGT